MNGQEEFPSKDGHRPDHPELPAKPPPPPQKPKQKILQRNLPSQAVFKKVEDAERIKDVGERELGFYLREVQTRKLYEYAPASNFAHFVRNRTGLALRTAQQYSWIAAKLDGLPQIDEAFSRGDLRLSAVRSIIKVATAETEKDWVEFAKSHRVDEVERRVAAARAGEKPKDDRGWGGKKVRYPYKFNVTPENHNSFEMLANVLSARRGIEVSVEDAICEAVKRTLAEEIQNNGTDGENGTEKKIAASLRLVIYQCPTCKEYASATPDGPVGIPAERVEELIKGVEVLDLMVPYRNGQPKNGTGSESQKTHSCARAESEVLENPQSLDEGIEKLQDSNPDPNSKPTSNSTPMSDPKDDSGDQKTHSCARAESEVLENPQSLDEGISTDASKIVKHAGNLDSPDIPRVPLEQRDIPISPELRLRVLSRDGYYCCTPGCWNVARPNHHIKPWAKGGLTTEDGLLGLCDHCHGVLLHLLNILLLSGTGENPIFSDWNRMPLVHNPSAETTMIQLIVERARERAPDIPAGKPEEEVQREAAARISGVVDVAPPGMRFEEFLGQRDAVQSLSISTEAAKIRGELPKPVLLSGPPGLGKTTLAGCIARELGVRMHTTCGPSLKDPTTLQRILQGLGKNEILFIDEIHSLPHAVAECLYQALDDGSLPCLLECGPDVQVEKWKLEPFLLVGATTEESLLPRPLHSRFSLKERLDFYSTGDLEKIVRNEGEKLGARVSRKAARILASGSRGTPRNLLSNLGRARDLAQIQSGRPGEVFIDAEIARRALQSQGIDPSGLDRMDRRIVQVLLDRGRPTGLRTLADQLGEERRTIAEIHEPYLLRKGLIARTYRGRVATEKAMRLFSSPKRNTWPQ